MRPPNIVPAWVSLLRGRPGSLRSPRVSGADPRRGRSPQPEGEPRGAGDDGPRENSRVARGFSGARSPSSVRSSKSGCSTWNQTREPSRGPWLAATAAVVVAFWVAAAVVPGCATRGPAAPSARPAAGRLLVAGREIPVAVAIVGPRAAGGWDASAERCVFTPGRVLPSSPAAGCDIPRRYGVRGTGGLDAATAARVNSSGWDARALSERVDQFVVHYDAAGTSRRCFEVLHDERGLSSHFLLDVDGTIRQTLDLVHRARHATSSNDRSVGVEIAHVGAYAATTSFDAVYRDTPTGLELRLPARLGPPPGGPFRPARPGFVRGTVNGRALVQPDFTEAQYRSLEALTKELIRIFPRIAPRVPRTPAGTLRDSVLPAAELAAFRGVLGHFHVQADKSDPGPAFDWDRIVRAIGATP